MTIKQRLDYREHDTVKVSTQLKNTHSKCVNPKKLQYKRDKKKQDNCRKQGRKEKTFQNEIYSEIKTSTHNKENTKVMSNYDPDFKEYLIGFWDNQKYKSGRWVTDNSIQYMDKKEFNDLIRIRYYQNMEDMKEYYEAQNEYYEEQDRIDEEQLEFQRRIDEEVRYLDNELKKLKKQKNMIKKQKTLEIANENHSIKKIYCPNCNHTF